MRRVAGFLMIVLGAIQGIWIAYNLFIETLPEFQQPLLPIGLTTLSFGLIGVGAKWMKNNEGIEAYNNKYEKQKEYEA